MKDLLLEDTFVVLDFETTGFDVRYAEVIDVGIVRVEGGMITETFSSLVDPGFFISEKIKNLTGITNAMLVGSPKMPRLLPRILGFIGDNVIVGHNVVQDLKFLDKYTRLYMNRRFKRRYLCTLELSRKVLPHLPSHSLESLADYFGIEHGRLHRALEDALVTAQVFLELLNILWNNYGIGDFFSLKKLSKSGRI